MTKSTGSEAFRSRRTCEPLARELTAPACPATQWALHRERAVERRDAVAESAQTAALEQRRLRRWRRRCTCNGPQSRSTRKSERTERWGTLFGLRQTCAYRPPMTSIAVIGSGTSARRSGRRGGALNGRLVIARRATSAPSACIARTCTPGSPPRARLARAFNTLGFEMFADPTVGARWRDRFWCEPKDAGVEQLIADVGLRPVRVGDIDAIDVDGVGRLWPTRVIRAGSQPCDRRRSRRARVARRVSRSRSRVSAAPDRRRRQTADDLPNAYRRDATSRPGPAGRARRTRR